MAAEPDTAHSLSESQMAWAAWAWLDRGAAWVWLVGQRATRALERRAAFAESSPVSGSSSSSIDVAPTARAISSVATDTRRRSPPDNPRT